MTCTSGSVEKVADKTVEAKKQIDKLQKMLLEQEAENKSKFFNDIEMHLADANIKDAREISYNSDIKTEYTSEFSLDKIAGVVTSALEALKAAKDPSVKAPATSSEAIDAYTDLVNSVAEAAKSSSTASASMSFSMNRLSPGMFAFLYASSVNIKDEDTFGTEAVTSTAIYYRFMQSIDDIKNEAAFGEAVIDAKNLMNMKTEQAALTDELASGDIDIDTWMKKDELYSQAIAKIQKRLDNAGFKSDAKVQSEKSSPVISQTNTNQGIINSSIKRLSTMGKEYEAVIKVSQERLNNSYY